MQAVDLSKITIDRISNPLIENNSIQLFMLRLDKIHPVISGNKWFKLKYHLENYLENNYTGIVTFGGAWSNHLLATAAVCYQQEIKSVGIIRGEKPGTLSDTLKEVTKYGMELKFISRELYKQRDNPDFMLLLKKDFPGYYFIPEGGSGEIGEKGCSEIVKLIDISHYSHIACAIGTGTMFNGISKAVTSPTITLGIAVLKGWKKTGSNVSHQIFTNYHFGGYAKFTHELLAFMNDYYSQIRIPTDFVYTGKLTYAVMDLIKKNIIPKGSNVLLIHSGGLQGNQSLPKGSLIF